MKRVPDAAGKLRHPVLLMLPALLLLAACGAPDVAFIYPDEVIDFSLPGGRAPALYIDSVTDMRPVEQREGRGAFLGIDYPADASLEVPATQIYAEALAQDLEQTQLVELVPLPAQADYILSVDLFSFGCRLERSGKQLAVASAIGMAAGAALGDSGSRRVKLGLTLGAVAALAVPLASTNRAEAEVRMTLKDRDGDVVWQKACLGEYEEDLHQTITARQDQELVSKHLTKAVKRANACLLGQLRQALLERTEP